jgi:hypothetical protein
MGAVPDGVTLIFVCSLVLCWIMVFVAVLYSWGAWKD